MEASKQIMTPSLLELLTRKLEKAIICKCACEGRGGEHECCCLPNVKHRCYPPSDSFQTENKEPKLDEHKHCEEHDMCEQGCRDKTHLPATKKECVHCFCRVNSTCCYCDLKESGDAPDKADVSPTQALEEEINDVINYIEKYVHHGLADKLRELVALARRQK